MVNKSYHHILCAYYLPGALYNLTHLNIFIIEVGWDETFAHLFFCYNSVIIIMGGIHFPIPLMLHLAKKTHFGQWNVGRSMNIPLTH